MRKEIIESFLNRLEKATISVDQRLKDSLSKEYTFLYEKYLTKKKSLGRELTDDEYYALFEELRRTNFHGILYLTLGYTGADLMRAMRVALFKALKKSVLLYDDYTRSLEVCGGTESHVLQSFKLAGVSPEDSQSTHLSELANTPKSKLDDLSDLDIDI